MNKNSSHLLPCYYLTWWYTCLAFSLKSTAGDTFHILEQSTVTWTTTVWFMQQLCFCCTCTWQIYLFFFVRGSDTCIIFLPILTSPAIRFCGKGCWYCNKWINCCCNSWRRYEWCPTWLKSLANGYSFWLPVLKLVVCVCSVTGWTATSEKLNDFICINESWI